MRTRIDNICSFSDCLHSSGGSASDCDVWLCNVTMFIRDRREFEVELKKKKKQIAMFDWNGDAELMTS